MPIARTAWLLAAPVLLPLHARTQDIPAPTDTYLYIISPRDGAVVKGAFLCRFGLRNVGVVRAGQHRLSASPDPHAPIPLAKRHIHFGEGETEAFTDLPPGEHTLQLVLGDAKHYPFSPAVISKQITIWVAEE